MLDEKGANPTVDGPQGDRAKVPGIEAPGTEGADDPKLTFLHAVRPCREGMKLSPCRIAVNCCGVRQQLAVDDDARSGSFHSVTGPCNDRLDQR